MKKVLDYLAKYSTHIVAVLFAVFLPLWHFVVVPEILELSKDFHYTNEINSYDNFYNVEAGTFQGEKRSNTEFSYQAVEGDSKQLMIRQFFDVRTFAGEPIFSVERKYLVDSHTGQYIDRDGYLFAPRMKGWAAQDSDRTHFTYWHVNYDTPISMSFAGEDTIAGLDLYRYKADFTVDQTQELDYLSEVGETQGVSLDVSLEIWVEPYTGYVVKYQDFATAYFYDLNTGSRLYPWNRFHNHISDVSVNHNVQLVTFAKLRVQFVSFFVPVFVTLITLCILFRRNILPLLGFGKYNHNNKLWVLPLLIAVVVLLVFVFLSNLTRNLVIQSVESEFDIESSTIEREIMNRLEIYSNAIFGARGLLEASEEVSRDEWRAYVEGLQITENYPGIQGLGYSVWLDPEDLTAHVASIQKEGFADYQVKPEGDRPVYTAVVYIEPFDERNIQAFGFDMYQEPTRQAAMRYARDTGEVSLSGRVTLVQEIDEDVQSGFLIYVPFYEKGADVKTQSDKQEYIEGFVYSPFRMNNFMLGTLSRIDTEVNIEVFDSSTPELLESQRMYGKNMTEKVVFSETKILNFGGHSWTLRFTAPYGYGSDIVRSSIPYVVFAAGLLFAFSLFFLLYTNSSRRFAAVKLANSMTADLNKRTEEVEKYQNKLKATNQELVEKASELSEKVSEMEEVNKHMVGRELKMNELKEHLKKIKPEDN